MKCRVSMSGFGEGKEKPDIKLPNGFNEVNPICRVCRVLFRSRACLRITAPGPVCVEASYCADLLGVE
jgi:hypothetical protein